MISNEILDIVVAGIILTAIWAQIGTFIKQKIRIVSLQALLLALYVILLGYDLSNMDLIILGILISALRGFSVPLVLTRKIKTSSYKVRERISDTSWITVASIFILIFSFTIYRVTFAPVGYETVGDAGLSLLLQGMFLMVSRRNKFSQFMGYMEEENAIIMLGIGIISLPLIIEASILLDVFALLIVSSVLIAGRFESLKYEELMG